MQQFSLSANIEEGQDKDFNYIVTPNAQDVASGIVNGYNSGIHSFTIIGSYGTGKSCFLLALEKDLQSKGQHNLINPQTLSSCKKYEVLKIVGDYKDLASLMRNKLAIDGTADNVLDELRNRYNQAKKRGSFLIIFIDEFGKVLEHAAKNDPEQELYFMQKLAEFVNVPTRQILLVTTLHQNFSAYARKLSSVQKEEWNKVKGRFKELVFIEPVEQLLYLASKQNGLCKDLGENASGLNKLCQLAKIQNLYLMDFRTKPQKPFILWSPSLLMPLLKLFSVMDRTKDHYSPFLIRKEQTRCVNTKMGFMVLQIVTTISCIISIRI